MLSLEYLRIFNICFCCVLLYRISMFPETKLRQLARAILKNKGPWSFLYGPRDARSVLPQPWAKIEFPSAVLSLG